MKVRKNRLLLMILCILILNTLILSGCENFITFSGSCISTGKKFELNFKLLNTTYDSWMTLSEGDRVKTFIEVNEGRVDIYVKHEDGTIIYQGNDVKINEFILEINKPGRYLFEVTGSNAVGTVHFNKLP